MVRCHPIAAFPAILLAAHLAAQGPLPERSPAGAGFSPDLAARLDAVLDDAIRRKEVPGAVLIAGREGAVVYRKARGLRIAGDDGAPMTVDTRFDLASLTKCVATAAAVAAWIGQGRIALDTPLGEALPDAAGGDLGAATIEHLLRHRSGLPPANSMAEYADGPAQARQRILAAKLRFPPGEDYLYSDLGFIVLGWVVEEAARTPLARAATELVFEPMGLSATAFRSSAPPAPGEMRLFAPTESAAPGEPPLCGVVHDPRARALGGAAGHAGLFGTADDLARFCVTMLSGGVTPEGRRALPAAIVRAMTDPPPLPPAQRRGLGFDMRDAGAGPRGAHFPGASFGHTGFTGTSFWMDPATKTFAILLASRLQEGAPAPQRLRHRIGTVVAEALLERPWPLRGEGMSAEVRTGIDRVESGAWPRSLEGARAGLITNHTGRTRNGASSIDVLHASPRLKLRRLFAPEHGIRGAEDGRIEDSTDAGTGLPVLSLYGASRTPAPGSLEDLDALVFDVQDIGARFYTYISTMVNAMEAAAEAGLAFVVLDRPNPIGGASVGGPVADGSSLDFAGRLRMPLRHGMTAGEIAEFARRELALDLDLHVVWMTGWRRGQWWDQTGLPWVAPSPNMRTLNAAALYPGIGLLETTNVSVGRGTATPFEIFGAPWLSGEDLANYLARAAVPGVRATATRFVPAASKHEGATCRGVHFEITDRRALDSPKLGLSIARFLIDHGADDWDARNLDRLLKHRETAELLLRGHPVDGVMERWREDLDRFMAKRRPCLLYEE